MSKLSPTLSETSAAADSFSTTVMMRACQQLPVPHTPVWLMRQAGRFMPAYRKIREKVGFLELCKNPDLVTEVTLLPIDQLGVDAAIIFADILLLLEPLGIELTFDKGSGPTIHNPVTTEKDVDRLCTVSPDHAIANLSYVFSAIKTTRQALSKNIPLIGFCGAPFTLAAYLIEGGSPGNLIATKTFMYNNPAAWSKLMQLLARASSLYLSEQIKAGAQIVQIFDSWLGYLSPHDFKQYVLPHSKNMVAALRDQAPVIYFGTSTGSLLSLIQETGCQVIGMDWRIDLALEWQNLDHKVAVQGNLDPVVLLSSKENIARQTQKILTATAGRPGHIFNLGHGVLPETPIENVQYLVELVHELTGSNT
jgi:uroporphyrinogen decarboxylase